MTHPTPSITLRAMEPEDLDLLYKIENDRQLWDVGATNVPYSRYALHEFMEHNSNDIFTDRQVRLVIELKDTREAIGLLDIFSFDPIHQRAEVGIVISLPHRGKGYAAETLRQAIEYARKVLHLHQLYAFIGKDNKASVALFKKMGFCGETTLKHWLYDGENYHDAWFMQFFL